MTKKLTAEEALAMKGMQVSPVGRRLLAKAWDQGFDAGISRPKTSTEAFHAPPVPENPYKRKSRGTARRSPG